MWSKKVLILEHNEARYVPFDIMGGFNCLELSLYELRHSYRGEEGNPLTAYYSLPNEKELLKIHFETADVVRVLDELFLNTEEYEWEIHGLKRYHFSYRVEGSRFFLSQSGFYNDQYPEAVHYRFITGYACLDVLSRVEPVFATVPIFRRDLTPAQVSAFGAKLTSEV